MGQSLFLISLICFSDRHQQVAQYLVVKIFISIKKRLKILPIFSCKLTE